MRRALPLLLAAAALAAAPQSRAQDAVPTLTQDDAIRLALQHNKNLIVSSFGKGISRAYLLAARGQFEPSLYGNRSGSDTPAQANTGLVGVGLIPLYDYRVDNYAVGIEGLTPIGTKYQVYESSQNERFSFYGYSSDYMTFGGFQVTQPLLQGFGFDANLQQVRLAKANRGISDWAYKGSAINTVTNVILAYSNLLLAHDQLDAARRSRDLANTLLAGNEKKYKVGDISQSDVIAARAYVALYEEPILIAEREVRDSQNTLRELIGEEVFHDDEPLFALVPPAVPEVNVNLKADLARALELRPDYQQARLGIVKDRAVEAAARNALLPQVNFVGGYGYNGYGSTLSASRQMVENHDNPSYSAGLEVTIPLTLATGRGNLRAARLTRQQADEDLRRQEADIAVAVATAAGQIETTRRRVAADQIAYDLALKALDAQEKKRLAGTSTTLEVIQQQEAVSSAQSAVSTAQASQRQAVAIYDMTLGTTLERHDIKLSED